MRATITSIKNVAAVGWPSGPSDRAALATAMGPGWRVVDIREAPPSVSALLLPPCSPRAVSAVRAEFTSARIVVIEASGTGEGLSDHDHLTPCRCLSAGADAHVLARGPADMAAAVLGSVTLHRAA
jgi:hypothetical protein